MSRPWLPPLLLALLGLVFFHDLLLHPDQVLYSDHSDLLAEYIPAKRFLVYSWHETGELPLWCPYSFAGAPFLHDIQVAAFYPPHLVLYLLAAEWVGAALSWLVVFHIIVAGWCMYAYARAQGWAQSSSLVAGLGFMFTGTWLLRLLGGGHYMLVGLAWLPLLLLLLERAIRNGGIRWSTAAGGVFALLLLGALPQYTFYSVLLVALWTLGTALEAGGVWSDRPRALRRSLGRWFGHGLWAVLLGAGLAAVQLLPTAEAARLSTRGQGIGSEDILPGALRTILFLVGPALSAEKANALWDDGGGMSLLWLMAAVLAALAARGRMRYLAVVAGLLLFFALGGAVLVQDLPGFRLFRGPTRMFAVLGFPLTFLAGAATQALFVEARPAAELQQLGRRILVRLLVGVVILVGGYAVRLWLEGKPIALHFYWPSLLVTVPVMFWLLRRSPAEQPRWCLGLWCTLLLADVWALTGPLVATEREEKLYQPSRCIQWLADQSSPPGRILDRDDPSGATPMGTGAPLALVLRLETLRGYNPIDYLRYREYLQFIAGSDAPLQALHSPWTYPVLSDFPIVHKRLLDLLGVRYLVQPTALPLETEDWLARITDEQPRAFDGVVGGMPALSPYTVYENRTVLPRAFFVYRAAPLPGHESVLRRLCATDFRKEVLLETAAPPEASGTEPAERSAEIRESQPNRVTVDVGPGPAGWLVLADLWYPGWTCQVDGERVAVERANYLFRAVRVPEGPHQVRFTFEPESYRLGRIISLATLAVWSLVLVLSVLAGQVPRFR